MIPFSQSLILFVAESKPVALNYMNEQLPEMFSYRARIDLRHCCVVFLLLVVKHFTRFPYCHFLLENSRRGYNIIINYILQIFYCE